MGASVQDSCSSQCIAIRNIVSHDKEEVSGSGGRWGAKGKH
jgi:hypothetical protein